MLRPAFGSGEDWNSRVVSATFCTVPVAPGLRVGRGLEPRPGAAHDARRGPLRPAFGSGEDWNDMRMLRLSNLPMLRPAFESGEDWNGEAVAAPETYEYNSPNFFSR